MKLYHHSCGCGCNHEGESKANNQNQNYDSSHDQSKKVNETKEVKTQK